jgi:hypothetical protein
MNSIMRKKGLALLAALTLFALATETGSTTPQTTPPRTLPNPVLFLAGHESVTTEGKQWLRYKYMVANSDAYPNELFAAAPELPPCGNNTKASRTWVDIYQQDGKRLNGFCALGKNSDLNEIWFALPPEAVPPSWVYIEMTDRKTNTKYKSNLAETVM